MDGEQNEGGGQAPPPEGGAGTSSGGQAPPAGDGGAGSGDQQALAARLAVLEHETQQARNEAARYRTELRKLQQEQEAAKPDADKTAAELAAERKRAAELADRVRDANLLHDVIALQDKLSLADVGLTLLALKDAGVEWDGEGENARAKDLEGKLTALLEAKPALKRQAAAPRDEPGNGSGQHGETQPETDAQRRQRLLGHGGAGIFGGDLASQGGGVLLPPTVPLG